MDDQRDVTDMGGTMRLGAYFAVLAPGSKVSEAYGEPVVSERHRHRYEFNNALPQPLRGRRLRAVGHVARRAPGRVRRARRPPVLGRHPGPPRVQEPARPAPPAVPRARRRGARRAREGRNPHLIPLDGRAACRRHDRAARRGSAASASGRSTSGHIWRLVAADVRGARRRARSTATSSARRARWPWSRCSSTEGRRRWCWSPVPAGARPRHRSRSPPACATSTARRRS